MDVLGGSAIIRGEKNLLAHAYFAIPISITVEGANILTRNLMQFGQGLIKSHPYILKQIEALNANDVKAFDRSFFSHVGLVNHSLAKTITCYFTRAYFVKTPGTFKRYRQKLIWASSEFTLFSNIALGLLGPALKKRENISARFGDMLSYIYLITATLREFDNNPNKQHKVLVDYVCHYAFNQIQIAKEDILNNLPPLNILLPFVRLNPISSKAEDKLNAKIVASLKESENLRSLTSNVFISDDKKDKLNMLQNAVNLNTQTQEVFAKIKTAVKEGKVKKGIFEAMIQEAFEKEIISTKELAQLKKAYKAKKDVIEVDAYKVKTYKALR